MKVSVGIMAHNEDKNIGYLLDSLFAQQIPDGTIDEVIIISSGSTDKTNAIVTSYMKRYPQIQLIVQKQRKGKAAAVNLFLERSRNPIVVLVSADVLMTKQTVTHLLAPLRKKAVGIVGAHPVPLNAETTFFGYTAHLLWDLHHQISLRSPKMGEMIAFRKIFQRIPVFTSVDEANIEPLIKGQGYTAVYAPRAIIYNKGPETLREFINRRRHIAAGHYAVRYEYHYAVATLSGLRIVPLLIKNIQLSWRFFLWVPAIILLEAYCRLLGLLDYTFKLHTHTVWNVTPSTKNLQPVGKVSV